jgi:acetyl-CoA C-acetyltransferase
MEAYIVAAARTAGGRRSGWLSGWHPADLAAQVINSLLARSGPSIPERTASVA